MSKGLSSLVSFCFMFYALILEIEPISRDSYIKAGFVGLGAVASAFLYLRDFYGEGFVQLCKRFIAWLNREPLKRKFKGAKMSASGEETAGNTRRKTQYRPAKERAAKPREPLSKEEKEFRKQWAARARIALNQLYADYEDKKVEHHRALIKRIDLLMEGIKEGLYTQSEVERITEMIRDMGRGFGRL